MLGLSPENFQQKNDNNTPKSNSAQEKKRKPEEAPKVPIGSPSN